MSSSLGDLLHSYRAAVVTERKKGTFHEKLRGHDGYTAIRCKFYAADRGL